MIGGEEVDEELIESLKKKDVLTEMLNELGREIPSIKKVLVDERDEYIACRIRELKGNNIVAVVGAGHVEGIVKSLKSKGKNFRDKIKELEGVREKKSLSKYVPWLLPLAVVGLLFAGFLTHDAEYTLDLIVKWFIIQGTMAALGAMLALAHPVTIMATFIAAPFALLHPLIAVGWISALVEMKMRKPQVKDFRGLTQLKGISDYWRNRVTRIFLVMILANLGGTLSTLVVIPYLAAKL
jgi:pheromone shutdown-related protein TraB